ncbi:MAG: hypothetical protein HY033_06025 [Ignavibacteriae bacterium]|nr:hypothetical protein [Ignavibacteria bacterium]MBI3364449.1 hypothetical protein [Ignavibacteriota bacterium]
MKTFCVVLIGVILVLAGAFVTGCDVGVNPLLFDGSPLSAKLRVEGTSGTTFDESRTLNIADVLSSIDKAVDSIKVFNITLQIDSLTDGTSDTTKVSGSATVDGNPLFTISNVPFSAFTSERSIFDNTISGFVFNSVGVTYLVNLLQELQSDTPPSSVTVRAFGNVNGTNLHFTVNLKLYTQVYTKAKK